MVLFRNSHLCKFLLILELVCATGALGSSSSYTRLAPTIAKGLSLRGGSNEQKEGAQAKDATAKLMTLMEAACDPRQTQDERVAARKTLLDSKNCVAAIIFHALLVCIYVLAICDFLQKSADFEVCIDLGVHVPKPIGSCRNPLVQMYNISPGQ